MVALDPGDKSVASGVFASFYAVDAACSWSNLALCSIYSAPFNITTEGVHNVYDFSSDNAGNAESPNIYAVNIDMTAPVSSANLSGNNPVVVTLSASDSLSGVANTTYQLDGGTPTTYAGPITVSATGSHRVTYYSTDNAGNAEAPPKSVTFTVSSAQVTIDDFTSGAYQSAVFKNGLKHLSTQNGIMLGGNRYTNMSLCKPGACGGANPFNQGVSYAFLPATASAPATMLQSAGYGSAPRIDLEYGQGTPMNADLSTSDRIRITFLGSTGTLNFNLLIYTGGSFGQNGCNLAASTVPFTVELPFSGFAGPGFTSSNINTLDFIFQNGSPIGGINFAIGSIQAVNGGQPGAIVCHLN
jgi:hypothetical protein